MTLKEMKSIEKILAVADISVSCRHVSPTMNRIPTPDYVVSEISEIIWYVAMECDRLTPSPTGATSP